MPGARIAISALALGGVALARAAPATPVAAAPPAATSAANAPPLTLESQTPWVGATAPWFNLSVGVGESSIPASQLRVSITFYGRIGDASELQEAMAGTPQNQILERFSNVPVTRTAGHRTATACVTVLPDSSVTPPAPNASSGGCIVGGPTVTLQCTQNTGVCGDVYPVSVALVRQGSTTALSRFTTFLTYEEPTAVGGGGQLRVGWVVPLGARDAPTLAETLSDHHQVPVTLAVSPRAAAGLAANAARPADKHTLTQLAALTEPGADQLLSQPYVPVNLAALEGAGLSSEIGLQLDRGAQLLRLAGLHPSDGTWVDVNPNLTNANASALANGLQAASAGTVIISDNALSGGASVKYTFAHPFSLVLSRAAHPTAWASDTALDSRFATANRDPVLAANQLLAGLSFVHFENAFLSDARGVVLVPPAGWTAPASFVATLLAGLGFNPALKAVTLDQLAKEVQGGTDLDPSPATRRLQSGSASTGAFTKGAVQRIALARQHLASLAGAAMGHPAILSTLSDRLLGTEAASLGSSQRAEALAGYDRQFSSVLSAVTLATEHTVTFTSRTAPIPITVLSSAPYPLKVVMTVQSDKFTFPGGATRTLTLDRPTTPVRVQALARTSGDRLPVEVTLHTPDGLLLIAKATVTVHSTAISLVGIALTVVALLVLLMWWGRTWNRSRRHRPRAH